MSKSNLKASLSAALRRNWPPSKQTVLDYITITHGCLLLAFGQLYFIKNLHIPMGGVNGIALVMNYLWGLPVGVMNILMNLPLFLLAWRSMGRRFFCRMVVGVFVSSIFIDALAPYVPSFQGEMLIAALYGGLVMGVGLALMYRSGGASGGSSSGGRPGPVLRMVKITRLSRLNTRREMLPPSLVNLTALSIRLYTT